MVSSPSETALSKSQLTIRELEILYLLAILYINTAPFLLLCCPLYEEKKRRKGNTMSLKKHVIGYDIGKEIYTLRYMYTFRLKK